MSLVSTQPSHRDLASARIDADRDAAGEIRGTPH